MPSAPSTSADPDLEVKARLPCLATGTPAPATTKAEQRRRCRYRGDRRLVPTMSIAPGGAFTAWTLARSARAARQLVGRLAAHLERHQEAAHLGRGGVAAGHDLEGALGLLDAQRLAAAHLRQKAAKVVDVAAHVKLLKVLLCRSLGHSLWATLPLAGRARRARSYITWHRNSSSRSPAWIASGCVKAVTRAATGAGTAPLSVDLKSGDMRLPAGADIPAITRAIQRAGFGVADDASPSGDLGRDPVTSR